MKILKQDIEDWLNASHRRTICMYAEAHDMHPSEVWKILDGEDNE
mgnify:CR=1 FL=1